MAAVTVQTVATFEAFADQWAASDQDNRLYWQLLGQLESDELLVRIPAWLAEEKVGYVDGSVPRAFIGRIDRETAQAIKLADAVGAPSLLKLAHSIHELERDEGTDRNEWLDRRLAEHRQSFASREDAPRLADPWLPKSQLELAIRRAEQ